MSQEERNKLLQALNSHHKIIYEVFQLLDKAPGNTTKTCWKNVVEIGEAISRQATIVGMIWTGEPPLAEEIDENMAAYVNVLHGFILVASGATAGAGPTMLSCVRASVKKVLDTSFQIMKESVDSHGTCTQNDRTIPKLAGVVWSACGDLEKTAYSNITAIGRALTKVAVSIKDVIREMNELKPGPTDSNDEVFGQIPTEPETKAEDDDNDDDSCGADLGNDLSPEEMSVAQATISAVSGVLALIKELIRCVTNLIKVEDRENNSEFIDSLEKLLKECQGIRAEIDELGACLYPPQEVPAMKVSLGKISKAIDNIQKEIETLNGESEAFVRVCHDLNSSLTRLKSELDRSDTSDLEQIMQRMELKN